MKVNVGLIGIGRLGRVYARDLATRVAGVRFAASKTGATSASATTRRSAPESATRSSASD